MSWQSREVPLTFTNGLTRSTSTVKLGGTLTESTTITQPGSLGLNFVNSGTANTVFNLAGTADFEIRSSGTGFFNAAYDGTIWLTYPGTNNAIYGSGTTPLAIAWFGNYYAGNTWSLSAGCLSSSAGPESYGLFGFNYGAGYGVFGTTSNGIGSYGVNTTSDNHGHLGGPGYGAYGQYGTSGNYGYLGGEYYGAYAVNNASGNYGYMASNNYGVYGSNASGSGTQGYLAGTGHAVYGYNYNSFNYAYIGSDHYGVYSNLGSTNTGDYSVFGYGVHASGVDGTDYGISQTLGGVKGYNYYGNPYTFGVAGYSYLDDNRSGGTFGGFYSGSAPWGCLGYKTSGGGFYGGYFTSTTTGTGKSSGVKINSGIGAWGDLFGADIHGEIYGAFMEGSVYGSFVSGDSYKTGLDVHLQKEENGMTIPLYSNVSADASIQTYGYSTLSDGRCEVKFDKSFSAAVSKNSPVIVTVTPMGNTGGVFLSEVNADGFKVVENDNRKSTVQFSYIAIGKRAGYEDPSLPQEIVAGDYVEKVSAGLHNDADMQTNGQGLYYENGQLTVGIHPSTRPDPNKPAVDPYAEKVVLPEKPAKATPPAPMPADRGNGAAPQRNTQK